MSEAVPQNTEAIPQDAEVGWQELASSKGEKYRVKASDYEIGDKPAGTEDEPSASGPSFKDVEVYWTVGSEGAPSQDVQNRTAITWYKFSKAPWYSVYTYRLTISTKDTYNYTFWDQEPDYYKLDVWQNSGTHTVEFSSGSPTIVRISGN